MHHKAEELYRSHAEQVYRFLYSLCREADTAEELTQETFCQAMKNLHTFRGDSTPQVWLCAIARRLWYKELERRRRSVTTAQETLDTYASPDVPEDDVQEREQRLALYRTMQKLDAETREVIHLRLNGEFSFREIGEIMGKTETWARVRFYRGKQRLTEIMGGGTE